MQVTQCVRGLFLVFVLAHCAFAGEGRAKAPLQGFFFDSLEPVEIEMLSSAPPEVQSAGAKADFKIPDKMPSDLVDVSLFQIQSIDSISEDPNIQELYDLLKSKYLDLLLFGLKQGYLFLITDPKHEVPPFVMGGISSIKLEEVAGFKLGWFGQIKNTGNFCETLHAKLPTEEQLLGLVRAMISDGGFGRNAGLNLAGKKVMSSKVVFPYTRSHYTVGGAKPSNTRQAGRIAIGDRVQIFHFQSELPSRGGVETIKYVTQEWKSVSSSADELIDTLCVIPVLSLLN